jgi:hypothetical protein
MNLPAPLPSPYRESSLPLYQGYGMSLEPITMTLQFTWQ